MNIFRIIFIAALSLNILTAGADDVQLTNLSTAEVDELFEEFSTNFIHTAVSPAKGLGDIWGIEVGLVAGVTPTSKLQGPRSHIHEN